MAKYGSLYTFAVVMLFMAVNCFATEDDRTVHIVYMGSLSHHQYSTASQHLNLLQEVTQRNDVENLLVRSYGRSFNGFVANITKYEAEQLAGNNEVVSVFPRTLLKVSTTRSWDFLGFARTARRNPRVESDVIVGMIDAGIWPESRSFSDEKCGPVPKKWKGECKGGRNFTCNKKIIGARYYDSRRTGVDSVRDVLGHGTHTASIAAGNEVKGASFYGLARGIARGGVPSARIAVYKVCDDFGHCSNDDVLAAFDDAIADGVDIISISIGSSTPTPLHNNPIAIGSFHAMVKGILTSHAAGNDGPSAQSVTAIEPWTLSVAASTIDRQFIDKLVLGNGKTLIGPTLNAFPSRASASPIIYAPNVAVKNCSALNKCSETCLSREVVRGKILICDYYGLVTAANLSAYGFVTNYEGYDDGVDIVPIPATYLAGQDYVSLLAYVNSTKTASAKLLKSEAIKNLSAPAIASFSSRGPNSILPDIMKPDITAPGVDILAAFSPEAPVTYYDLDKRHVQFSILSGTSMACPHATGVAAYVKTFHPDWSPSAIKSAIMTTASPMNATKHPQQEFAYGSGHINPLSAVHPGLVYDASKADYIQLLCDSGYDTNKLRIITGDNSTCSKGGKKSSPWNFNYPSLITKVTPGKRIALQFHRTVTNVGMANSTYKAEVTPNSNYTIKVDPQVLSFKSIKEKKSFTVTVSGEAFFSDQTVHASLVWSDGAYVVRSPIVLY